MRKSKKIAKSVQSSSTSSNTNNSLNDSKIIAPVLIIITVLKLLLIPSYYSTDFDVHRNWLSITYNLPLSQWYFDNYNGSTVHTLDYPPSFAYFEYILGNNFITSHLLSSEIISSSCLQQSRDDENSNMEYSCIVFQRCTVILSDFILFLGAYFSSKSLAREKYMLVFIWIVSNPGLFILDHVHFQYNGMLLGILLISLRCLLKNYILVGAMLFGLLLTFKHLYLVLAPLYFIYLLKWYCINNSSPKLFMKKISTLGAATLTSLIAPFIPFLLCENPQEQIVQIFHQLFPFQRGLVHDYWAGNIWALYLASDKILRKYGIILPEITAKITSILLLVLILPCLVLVWRGNKQNHTLLFLHGMIYCAFTSFMVAYHVHEKAIMTAIIPLTLLIPLSKQHAQLYLRTCLFGHFGLLPLLFRSNELVFKSTVYMLHLVVSVKVMEEYLGFSNILGVFDKIFIFLITATFLFMELIHPLVFFPKLEFLPLLITSVICAFGLVICWIHSAVLMWRLYRGRIMSHDKKLKRP